MPTGRIVSIHTTPEQGAPMATHASIEAIAGRGLAGDRYAAATGTYSGRRLGDAERAITFIEQEALDAVRTEHGIELGGHETRRNVVTLGIALNELVGLTFRVGDAEFLGVDLAVPCAYLESLTRPGVLRALVDRGGVRAEIVSGGTIRVDDPVAVRPTTA